MLNHLRYWPFTLVCLMIAIKDFRYQPLLAQNSILLRPKLVPLDSWLNMVLRKLSFIATWQIKQLFCEIRWLFIIFLVLVVVPITLAKQEKRYMHSKFNILGLIITALFANISKTAQVSNISLILRAVICNSLRHHHLFKTVAHLI